MLFLLILQVYENGVIFMNEIDKLFKNIEDGVELNLNPPVDIQGNIMAASIDDNRISSIDAYVLEQCIDIRENSGKK